MHHIIGREKNHVNIVRQQDLNSKVVVHCANACTQIFFK